MGNRVTLPCNMDSIEASAALADVRMYPDDTEEYLMVDKMRNYLFYRSESSGRRRECICSHAGCGRFVMEKRGNGDFFRHKHNDTIECPQCHGSVRMIALNKMRNFGSINDESACFTICRVASDGGLILLSGYGKRQFSWNDLRPHINFSEKVVTYLKPGKRFQKNTRYMPIGGGFWGWEWYASERVQEPFNPFFYYNEGKSHIIAPERIADTDLRYCQVDEYFSARHHVDLDCSDEPVRNLVKYLSAYTQYPTIEMAVKLGLNDAVDDLICLGRKNADVLNWKSSTIQGFLRLNKQEAKAFVNADGDLKALKAYRIAKKKGMIPDMKKYMELIRAVGGVKCAERLTEIAGRAGVTIQVAAHYIAKNIALGEASHVLTLWGDYLNMAQTLGYDMSRRDVVMPKNLRDRHDAASETVRYQKMDVDEDKYRDFNKRMRKMYEFEYGGLCITVPGSAEEIIMEGKTLKHCVGGYAARHFGGETVILFLRHFRKKHTPFITIELASRSTFKDDVHVCQIHGYRNERYGSPAKRPVPPAVKYGWFFEIYFEWLRNGSRRDGSGKPILPTRKELPA